MIDTATLARHLDDVIRDIAIPELPDPQRGKVRNSYDLPDGRRIIVATDRLSAFDRILAAIPLKGQVLTQTARFWFDATRHVCPNHIIGYPDPNVTVCHRLHILPVEMVVRDYLAGTTATSIWSMYREGRREMYGLRLPDGMRENQKLPATIVTPTTKAAEGGHDEPLSRREIIDRGLLTVAQWDEVERLALTLFATGSRLAAQHGLILADTKYEFGFDRAGRIVLADEVHTPDSSRFWFAGSYQQRLEDGRRPESFDKDVIRAWVAERCDPYADEIPELPREIILHTAQVYIQAFETITGQPFALPTLSMPAVERIRANVLDYLA